MAEHSGSQINNLRSSLTTLPQQVIGENRKALRKYHVQETLEDWRFGEFVIRPQQNLLEGSDHQAKSVPSKTIEVLMHLVLNHDRVVSADELLETHWQGRVVEESTIHRQISQIRLLLGDSAKSPKYIKTVPKKGYQAIALATPFVDTPVTSTSLRQGSSTKRNLLFSGLALVALFVLLLVNIDHFNHQDVNQKESLYTIAVLPFTNTTNNEALTGYAEGLVDNVLNELVKNDELRVASRTETFKLVADGATTAELARDLKVAYFVEGSIQQDRELTRVIAQLIRVKDNFHVWSKTYDVAPEASLAIQAQLSGNIALRTTSKLGFDVQRNYPDLFPQFVGVKPEAVSVYIDSEEEYANYAMGEEGDTMQALDLMKRSADLDPSFTFAQLQLAWNLSHRIDLSIPPLEAAKLAHELLDRVVANEGQTLEATFYRAHVYLFLELDYSAAKKLLEAGNAQQPEGRWWKPFLSMIAAREGRKNDALRLLNAGLSNDFGEESYHFLSLYAFALLEIGDYHEAYDLSTRLLQLVNEGEPYSTAMRVRVAALIGLGKIEIAEQLLEETWQNSNQEHPASFAPLFADVGQLKRAASLLEGEVFHGRRVDHIYGHLAVGNIAKALDLIEESIRERDESLLLVIRVSRRLDSIRSDSRFIALTEMLEHLESRTDSGFEV